MTSDCKTTQAVVKNTFIEYVLPKPVQRRCASVPSCVRLNVGLSHSEEDAEFQQLFKGLPSDASFSPISDASTDSGAASDEESVDSAPTNRSSSSAACSSDNMLMPVVQAEFPQEPYVMLVADSLETVLSFLSPPPVARAKLNSNAKAFEGQATKLSTKTKLNSNAEAFEGQATKLSTKAKTFTPGCCLREKPSGMKLNANARKRCARFRWQCQQVILAAKEAVEGCSFVQSVELAMEKSHMSVDTYIRPECHLYREQVLSKAKQALLDKAESSQGVYVLGYRSKPFMPTLEGFFALLGVMTCEKDACWDTFCYGCCGNEDSCSLQHPTYQVPIYFNLKIANEL